MKSHPRVVHVDPDAAVQQLRHDVERQGLRWEFLAQLHADRGTDAAVAWLEDHRFDALSRRWSMLGFLLEDALDELVAGA